MGPDLVSIKLGGSLLVSIPGGIPVSVKGQIRTGFAGRGHWAQRERINMLPLGRPVSALSEDQGLSKRFFFIIDLHGGIVKPCHKDFRNHERCL